MNRLFPIFGIFLLAVAVFGVELPFPLGEELIYSASWNGIPVGHCTITTTNAVENGREVLAIRMRSQTYAFFDWFFKVDDHHESLVDPETLLPIRFTKNLQEGEYHCHEITTFDHKAGKAYYEHQTNGEKKTYAIQPDTRDILSFMYFMRGELLEPEHTTEYRVMADEKIYDLIVNAEDLDWIDLPHYEDEVLSLQMVPEAKFDGLFVRKGKATLWVSRDLRRLLTFAKIKVPFGRLRITLQEVRGPGSDFWITQLEKDDDE